MTPPTPENKSQSFSMIFRKIVKRHPLVLVFLTLLLTILILGILLCVKRCSHSLGAEAYATSGTAPVEAYARLDSIVMRSQERVYGLPAEDFDVERGEIESGETFSRLLNQRYNVNISIVNRLIELSKGKFELRDIRAGHTYTAFLTPDSTQTL